jgi:uncharacterized protein with PQ loop repeat
MTINTQEYFGWIGNGIFVGAQSAQVFHSFKTKKTKDISYFMVVLMLLGNGAYTAFGIIDNSMSLAIGSSVSLFVLIIQLYLKIYYENCYKKIDDEETPLLPEEYENDLSNNYSE